MRTIRVFILVGVFLLSGCEMRVGPKPRACTVEQMSMMSKYVAMCERGYLPPYCFDTAQEAYCKEEK